MRDRRGTVAAVVENLRPTSPKLEPPLLSPHQRALTDSNRAGWVKDGLKHLRGAIVEG